MTSIEFAHSEPTFEFKAYCDIQATDEELYQNHFDDSDASLATLYAYGHYPMLIKKYGAGYTGEFSLTNRTVLVARAIHKLHQICGLGNLKLTDSFMPYVALVDIMESNTTDEELLKSLRSWCSIYSPGTDPLQLYEIVLDMMSEPPFSTAKRAIAAIRSKEVPNTLRRVIDSLKSRKIDVEVLQFSEFNIDINEVIDMYVADILITDEEFEDIDPINAHRVYLVGSGKTTNHWSMSYQNEVLSLLNALSTQYSSINIFMFKSNLIDLAQLYSDQRFNIIQLNDFSDADAYFAKKRCEISDLECENFDHETPSVILGDKSQTAFINSYMKVLNKAEKASTTNTSNIYITSMSTWDGLNKADIADLENTQILDSDRLSLFGNGTSKEARLNALISDLLAIYALRSMGADFSQYPYHGYSGIYHVKNNSVTRTLRIFETKSLASKTSL